MSELDELREEIRQLKEEQEFYKNESKSPCERFGHDYINTWVPLSGYLIDHPDRGMKFVCTRCGKEKEVTKY